MEGMEELYFYGKKMLLTARAIFEIHISYYFCIARSESLLSTRRNKIVPIDQLVTSNYGDNWIKNKAVNGKFLEFKRSFLEILSITLV